MSEETVEQVEAFSPDKWLDDIINEHEPEIEAAEADADRAMADDKARKATVALAKDVQALKDSQRKDRMGRRVKEFVSGIPEGDPRNEFMWILENAKDEDSVEKAIGSIENMGKKAQEKLAADRQADDELDAAFSAPIDTTQSAPRKSEADVRMEKIAKGDTNALAEELGFGLPRI